MQHYSLNLRVLAYGYAGLAGFVDALGFIASGGFFVSFMSGNTTRFAIGVYDAVTAAGTALGLIVLFMFGVVVNRLWSAAFPPQHRKQAASAGTTFLLALSAGCALLRAGPWPSLAFLCMAMGGMNAIFQRDGTVGIGLTYMTGALVRVGYGIADHLAGRPNGEWLSNLALWFTFVVGCVAGALCHYQIPHLSLWLAVGYAIALTMLIRDGSAKGG